MLEGQYTEKKNKMETRWDRVKVMEKNKVLRWYWETRGKSEKLGNRDIRRFVLMLLLFNLKKEKEVFFFLVFLNKFYLLVGLRAFYFSNVCWYVAKVLDFSAAN